MVVLKRTQQNYSVSITIVIYRVKRRGQRPVIFVSTESYVLLRRKKHARPQLKFGLEVCSL